MSNENIANRFSQLYKHDTKMYDDSSRFRVRFYTYLDKIFENYALAKKVQEIIGVKINFYARYDIENFINSANIKDVLDTITICYELLKDTKNIRNNYKPGIGYNRNQKLQEELITFINQCFLEENLCYIVDENGIAHFNPDEEFHYLKNSTLRILQDKRYVSVVHEFKKVYKALDSGPGHAKDAIGNLFKSTETLFRLLCNNDDIKNLSSNPIAKYLPKIAEKVYQVKDQTTLSVVNQKIEEFKKWTDSAQPYRHGQATEDIDEPPLSLAILIISTGASFLRWLALLGQAIREMNTE